MSRERKSLLEVLWSRIKKPAVAPPVMSAPRPFQAVSIYCGAKACPTARRFRDHRVLAKDAPALPLASCTQPNTCECRYLKHKDRRGEVRRFAQFTTRRDFEQERRRPRARGRRATD